MHSVRQWALRFIAQLLDLLNHSFRVFLTSDHGNIEATGIGRPSEGAIADLRGERVRVYPDQTLRAKVKADFPSAIEWAALGLPGLPTTSSSWRSAFVSGKRIVGHGGISLRSWFAAQAQRRIKEQLGEREAVSRAARRVLRCFVDWGVLQDTSEKGVYQSAQFTINRGQEASGMADRGSFGCQ